jgi:hypothetical protein
LAVEIFGEITRAALRGEPVKNGKTFWLGSGPVEKFPLMTKGGSLPAPICIQPASVRYSPLPHFEFSYDKVSDKN